MKASELFPGAFVRVNHDGLCIKKFTIVEVRGIDADDSLAKRGLIGGAHCRPLDDDQFEGGIWCEYLDPIPLTPEILEKNFRGYKLGSGALAYFIYELNEDYFIRASAGVIYLCMHYDDSEHAAHDDIYLVELKYVHTLQLALMLFGFDKEIVL